MENMRRGEAEIDENGNGWIPSGWPRHGYAPPEGEAWYCYGCGRWTGRGAPCPHCGVDIPPRWDDPLERVIVDGKFRCPTCEDLVDLGTWCPRCGSRCDPPPVEGWGQPRGEYLSLEEAPWGVDPLEGLPIVLNDKGDMTGPPTYLRAHRDQRAWERRYRAWIKSRVQEEWLHLVPMVFPEPKVVLLPPLCRRCKLPAPPRGPRQPPHKRRARQGLHNGLCPECRRLAEIPGLERDRRLEELREEASRLVASASDLKNQARALLDEAERIEDLAEADHPGDVTSRERALYALIHTDRAGCSMAEAARCVGFTRQKLWYWRNKLTGEFATDLAEWRLQGRVVAEFWVVQLGPRCKAVEGAFSTVCTPSGH